MKDLVGRTLGQYEIREKVGQGGMAQVFKAYQPGLDRFVAVKVLSPLVAQESGFTERFQREAHSAGRLHHPNILEVYDFGVQDNYHYLVMRYVKDSRTLGDEIRARAPLGRLINYIVQVAEALNYAQKLGVIHRDVKPGNILIDGKWALLADFGLAKIAATSSTLTGTGVGIGTPAYMSPEQASGASVVDHRTDIYALGVILYRILTGTVPHDAPTPFAILARRCTEPARPPSEINPQIPEFDDIVLRSLKTEPNGRYNSATQFADALEKVGQDPRYKEEAVATIPRIPSDTGVVDRPAEGRTATRVSEDVTPPSGEVPVRRQNLALLVGAGVVAAVIVVGVIGFFLLSLILGNGTFGTQSQPTANTEIPAVISITETPVAPADTATPIPPSTPALVAKMELEVWSGPDDNYELLGYLPVGAVAEIVGRDQGGEWWQIKTSLASAGSGWIRAGSDFSETTGTDNVPIALAPPTSTITPVPATPTATATPLPDTSTPGATPAPDTPTSTPTATPLPDTPTPSATPAPDTPTSTATATPLPDTPTPSATPVPDTPTSTATATRRAPSPTPTKPPSPTPTRVPTVPAGQITLVKPASIEEPTYGPTEFEWRWGSALESDQGFEVRVWREGEPPAGVHNAVEDNQSGRVVAVGDNTYRLNVDIRDAYGVQGRSGEYLWTVVLVQISPGYADLGIQADPGRLRFEAGGDGGDGGDQPPVHD